jgi:hypothetical protein
VTRVNPASSALELRSRVCPHAKEDNRESVHNIESGRATVDQSHRSKPLALARTSEEFGHVIRLGIADGQREVPRKLLERVLAQPLAVAV